MKITWYGHACFKLEFQSGSVVLDPYSEGSVPGLSLPPLEADIVLCSHGHADHGAAETVKLTGRTPALRVERLDAWHDEVKGEKRGANTIHIIEGDGLRAAHLGDLGHELTPGQIGAIGRLDALMIPVGGYYTIDAAAAKRTADAIGATVTIPMHYRGDGFGYEVLTPVSDFAALCDNVEYAESSIVLKSGGSRKTIVFKLVK
ncbi:MAG TPA: Zn-dependent hydrolase [Clostridiales bacterium]|nr:Zn-dependent hydrolase [Clostridiales bacterium]